MLHLVAVLASLPVVAFIAQGQVLLWTKHTKPLILISPAAAALNLILVAVLLPPFGLIGAAAATVLAVLAQAAMTRWAAARIAHVPWHWTSDAVCSLRDCGHAGCNRLAASSHGLGDRRPRCGLGSRSRNAADRRPAEFRLG